MILCGVLYIELSNFLIFFPVEEMQPGQASKHHLELTTG